MPDKQLSIGMFGFGCVGQGLYDVLNNSQGLKADIDKICVIDRNKKRKIGSSAFTFERKDLLNNGHHNLIVELINDNDAALEIINSALQSGKNAVSANKKMIADNFEYLFKLQLKTGSSFLYEGACGGSIPIIRTLEEYYDNELLKSLRGIINGSSNYVLSKMDIENKSYREALREAQDLGFAESNPASDVSGYDSKYKLCILTAHAFGIILKPESILNLGIQNISSFDINYSNEKNKRIKLVAHVEKSGEKYKIYVLPHLTGIEDSLHNINYEFNAVEVEGVFSDRQLFSGKGAGSYPTGSAVLSDISAITYNYKYGYKKLRKRINGSIPDYSLDVKYLENDFELKLYIRYKNEKDLEKLKIVNVEESYSSENNKYIIANVVFSSLFNIANSYELFVCCVE